MVKIKIDPKKLKEERISNFKERIWFIKYWVEYMKKSTDKEWSGQQAKLINAQFENLKNFKSE